MLIRASRVNAGLTQAEVARRAATSQPAVARYESGVSSPSVRTLERLLRACGQRLALHSEPASVATNLQGHRIRALRAARPEIERLSRAVGVRNLRVFGSVARGEDVAGSDIDVLVDFTVGDSGVLPLVQLRQQLSDLLGEDVDLATPDLLAPEIAERAVAEAVPL